MLVTHGPIPTFSHRAKFLRCWGVFLPCGRNLPTGSALAPLRGGFFVQGVAKFRNCAPLQGAGLPITTGT